MEPVVCIDASVIGTKRHLLVDNRGAAWSSSVPPTSWHFTGQVKPLDDKCFDSLLKLAGVELRTSPPERFVKSIAPLLSGSGAVDMPPPWQQLLPAREHRALLERLSAGAVGNLAKLPVGYFEGTWVPGNAALRALQRARVDATAWRALAEAGGGNTRVLATFEPDNDGWADPIEYDRFGTLTGRLTVASGPNILTLKREHRAAIVSSFPGGRIYSVDFAALEARVLLYEAGRRCDDPDLYGMLARELGGVSRQAAKGAVISELYGSSKEALGRVLGLKGRELQEFTKRVKAYFNTRPLLKRIKREFVESGKIFNRYGRPVAVDEPLDHVFVNYYAQSTGADVAMQGFAKLFSDLRERVPEARPLFLLHDAAVIDVPPEGFEAIESVKQLRVPGYVQPWPVKVEQLSCTR